MSEEDQGQKTEEATPKRRQKFRDEGQIARSQDASAVVSLAAATAAIIVGWPIISSSLTMCARGLLGRLDAHGKEGVVFILAGKTVIGAVAPVAIPVLLFGIAGHLAQVGFNFTAKPLIPNLSKFNPITKLKDLFFSWQSVIELIKSIVKVCVIGVLAVDVLVEELHNHSRLAGLSPGEVLTRLGEIALAIMLRVGLAFAAIAIFDILIERYRHAQKMKMSKQEVKDEHKESEGDPQVRGRIRMKQREGARQRMLQDVELADVVVVNPSHYSVAIRYNLAEDAAPKILASGMDDLAFKIRERARHNSIPVVSDPPLARGLYKNGKVGGYIPANYYQAVAALLAWVYSLTGRVA
ncbi:MAG: flagellar biosynthesis protein FlhB [Deltaproteobacteria bacterium]|nr:flagellar biosynthesis protein FlhB [Deltaproteobacteria bacterium]